jgi:hypothetical protein
VYFGLGGNGGLELGGISEINKGKLDTKVGSGNLGEVSEGSSVQVIHGNNMITSLQII